MLNVVTELPSEYTPIPVRLPVDPVTLISDFTFTVDDVGSEMLYIPAAPFPAFITPPL